APRTRMIHSGWWVLAIVFTRTMTQERRLCRRSATRCWKVWVIIPTTHCLRWRLSSSTSLADDYFVEKNLSPNIDFYSAITLRALGFPTEMITVLYTIARTAGWIAHWKEMIDETSQRIGRPRQLYTGLTERTYVPIEARSCGCSKVC